MYYACLSVIIGVNPIVHTKAKAGICASGLFAKKPVNNTSLVSA